jgi:EAL domain-containing protein (putative c-di-GMP-specific phosphodiesterase class I)
MSESLLHPVFQPVVRLSHDGGHRLSYFEVLMRMTGDSSNSLHVNLIRAGERMGFIGALDITMLGKSLEILEACPCVNLSINLSVDTVEYFFNEVDKRLDAVPPEHFSRLIIEVTETHCPQSYAVISRHAEAMRRKGIRLAVDDFGEGFGDEKMVEALLPAIVKMPGSAITDDALVFRAVSAARSVGGEVVAEHVTTHEAAKRMLDMGVTYAQGFLFGRPSSALSVDVAALEQQLVEVCR